MMSPISEYLTHTESMPETAADIPLETPTVSGGYRTDQFLVTLHPSVLTAAGPASVAAARSLAIDESSFRGFERSLVAAVHETGLVAVLDGSLLEDDRPLLLVEMERRGWIRDTVPLRRPRQDEEFLSERLPVAGGRAAAAAVESFTAGEGRPSDGLLAGTVLVTVRGGDAERVQAELLNDPGSVASVEPVPVRKLQQIVPLGAMQPVAPWHLERIGLHRARRRRQFDNAQDVRVAVLDTGIDADHPLLREAIDFYGYSPPRAGITSGARDIIGHGTHVAGTIAAAGASGDIEGVCRARLHVHKIFDDDVDSTQHLSRVGGELIVVDEHYVNEIMYMRALAMCIDNNYDVVNLSIGGGAIGHSREQAHYRNMIDQGQIVVAAMGNDRRDGSPTNWPAAYPGVIAVGALDLNDGVAPFSNAGAHISISAPGVDILATMPNYRGVEYWIGRRVANGGIVRDQPVHWTVYRSTMRGTSMAAPQIAGAAALWVARNGGNRNGFRQKLEESARKLPLMGSVIHTDDYGHGCLDVAALLR